MRGLQWRRGGFLEKSIRGSIGATPLTLGGSQGEGPWGTSDLSDTLQATSEDGDRAEFGRTWQDRAGDTCPDFS